MITILYRPNSEHERAVLDFKAELKRNQVNPKLVDVDSKEGIDLVELYDASRYPAVLASESDGTIIQSWKGELPTIAEVSYYAHV
jgi:hypothetical protein